MLGVFARLRIRVLFLPAKMAIKAGNVEYKFEIFQYGMPGFEFALSTLITQSGTSPVYSTEFCSYYQELRNVPEENMSVLVKYSGESILGFLFSSTPLSKGSNHELSYFGLPAALITLETASAEVLNGATVTLLQFLNDSGISVSKGRILIPHTIQVDPVSLQSNKIERLFFANDKVVPRFDRRIFLNEVQDELTLEYSKSVKMALKKEDISTLITSCKDNQKTIRHQFEALKRLHLESAGKLTRSVKSWELQFEMVKNGSALIVSGAQDNEIVTSALFMLHSGAAFYGVSASNYTENSGGLSHHLIDCAIKEFKFFGIDEIWLGSQHTVWTTEISNKEQRIEEFKSYFGGSLQTTLISSPRI